MILHSTDMKTFFDQYQRQNIVCFGAGNEFCDMIRNFSEFQWHQKIIALLDNDKRKWGKYVEIGEGRYRVESPSEFFQNNDGDYVIIICNSYYREIKKQLDAISKLDHRKCYIYEFMMCKSLHEHIPIKKSGAFLIPPVIHYCWFGKGNIPDNFKRCIESWHKFCPRYKIIEWNEENCNLEENKFAFEAYKAKKYGFVPDYFRLKIIYENGGIYLDTDVEVLKNLDDLRRESSFCGLERPGVVAFGLGFGAQKHNPIILQMLQRYQTLQFSTDSEEQKKIVSPPLQTKDLIELGMRPGNHWQQIKEMTIFPIEVLSPKHFVTGETEITEYSYAIHHFAASWVSEKQKLGITSKQVFAQELLSDVK